MPPQSQPGVKPDPTMLLCYVPNLVFTLIRDDSRLIRLVVATQTGFMFYKSILKSKLELLSDKEVI